LREGGGAEERRGEEEAMDGIEGKRRADGQEGRELQRGEEEM
jgi:hypothetical protein